MKFLKNLVAFVAIVFTLMLATLPAKAQSGFDVWGGTRTLVLQAPTNIQYQTSVFGATNLGVDMKWFTGIGKIDISCGTNAPGTAVGGIQVSADMTNWAALANYGIANPTSIPWTNRYYLGPVLGTNVFGTNYFNLPGTNTTPSAATAGFATTYMLPAPMTNTAATVTLAAGNAVTTLFANLDDQPRYWRFFVNVGGTGTNVTVSATVTGKYQTSTFIP